MTPPRNRRPIDVSVAIPYRIRVTLGGIRMPSVPRDYRSRCQPVRVAEGAISAKTEKFIRNSSGIHPEFIRQSASSVLILRASGGKDSTECSRRGPLGKQLGAQRSSTDREEVAIKGTPGARTPTDPGVGRGMLGGYCTNPSSARLEEPMPSLTADGTVHTNY
jgi:hypothetical protein